MNVKGLFKCDEIYPIADIRTDIITVRNEVGKVMFLQVSVCPQWGGAWSRGSLVGGGSWSGGVPGPRGVPGLGVAWFGEVGIPACTEADPPGETATAVDGTHPTGMHSCFALEYIDTLRSLRVTHLAQQKKRN